MYRLILGIVSSLVLLSCKKDKDSDTQSPPPVIPDTLTTGWTKVNLGTTNSATDIFFIGNTGFAVAGSGIYRSTNGGDTWQKVYQPEKQVINIGMGSTSNAVFTSPLSDKIYSTADGGNTFDSTVLQTNITDVFFTSPTVAYAIGGKIWKSVNGGKNWTGIYTFPAAGAGYNALYFLTEQTGWSANNAGLHKTINGGLNWSDVVPISPALSGVPNSVFFFDSNNGFIADGSYVGKTANGGTNWTRIYSGKYTYHDIHFLTATTGYITDENSIYKTTDGGTTWTREVKLGANTIVELHFTDANHGWACVTDGTVLKYVK